jgi:cell wall-associated NlpC family hydrolase
VFRRVVLPLALALVVLTGVSLVPAAPAGAAARPSAGARIVHVAKRYVGKAHYRWGGASPRRGFDCSGYVMYAYRKAHVARLPHNAQAQRHARHMHRISRRSARPGDLVFYLSGGRAYHVAIYAGHGRQYSAASPRYGIRYQRIWSRHVEFRTDWH